MTKTFEPARDIPDLSGNAGLGAETIKKLAAHNPRRIYLCARSPAKAKGFTEQMKAELPSAIIEAVDFDLSSLASAKSAAASILRSTDRIDLLFLNAGVAGIAPALTQDGYEWQFGVNHLAHAQFVQVLMPLLVQSAQTSDQDPDVRIITVASEAAKVFVPKQGLVLDEMRGDMARWGGMARYGHSKLANVLFAKKLAQMYPCIRSMAVHPGMVRTENQSKADGAGWFMYLWKPLLAFTGLTVEEGAKTQLWAATASEAQPGKFYFPVGKEDDGGQHGNDVKMSDDLWRWTEKELALNGGIEWTEGRL
ncbi:hypothetical protein D0869_06414 [Hortaea werneckii]|uniref:Oxidoreductase n=1 Tax=Hortaea werneckii TaxID=91943 RepID=A0A3M6YSN0_HORWE|nr:hypothetical protein KC324_g1525 [Hortaea werneckii]KAI7593628.1 hypothetical protein KC316_g1613 [Hortaea werneckii]RMX81965.1 hypothetical protein D0869_06414 [Hortaea werneckii]RMY06013.1 hypothetical protein D0868_06099 [Hortaea werneckii]